MFLEAISKLLIVLEIDYFGANYIRFTKGWMDYLEVLHQSG